MVKKIMSAIITILVIAGMGMSAYAATETFTVSGVDINNEKGDGSDGSVELRVNGSYSQIRVNGGAWQNISTATTTIPGATIGTGVPDQTGKLVTIANLLSKVSGSNTASFTIDSYGRSTITNGTLQFTDFTVGAGIIFEGGNAFTTFVNDSPYTFTTYDTVLQCTGSFTNNGIVKNVVGAVGPTWEADGGRDYGQSGGQAPSVAVYASNFINTGYILGGYGNIGAEAYYDRDGSHDRDGTSGGRGGHIYIVADMLTNSGYIRTGHGGGGGKPDYYSGSVRQSGGDGGEPGMLVVSTKNLTNTGVMTTGFKGGSGSGSSGVGVWDGTNGTDLTVSSSPSSCTSSIALMAQNITTLGTFGFIRENNSQPINTAASGVTICTDLPNFNYKLAKYNQPSTIILGLSGTWDLTEMATTLVIRYAGDLTLNNCTSTTSTDISRIGSNRNLVINNSSIAGGSITASNITLNNSTVNGTAITPVGNILANASAVTNSTIISNYEVRFRNTPSPGTENAYLNTTLNGLKLKRVALSVGNTDGGLNQISMPDMKSYYYGPLNGMTGAHQMDIKMERSLDATSWSFTAVEVKNVSDVPVYRDLNTVPFKPVHYRLTFRLTGTTGWFVDEALQQTITSPGAFELDSTAPTINYFSIAQGQTSVDTENVTLELIANDNRTQPSVLKVQIQVNGTRYNWFNATSSFSVSAADDVYGDYNGSMTNLPLIEGNNLISVRVMDEAGNIQLQMKQLQYIKTTGSSVTPDVTPEVLDDAVTISDPDIGADLGTVVINGKTTYVSSNNEITLVFDSSKLPVGIKYVRYAIAGDNFSSSKNISLPLEIQLSPVQGIHKVKLEFVTSDGLVSSVPTPLYIDFDREAPSATLTIVAGSSLTKGATVSVEVAIRDNVSSSFEWSLDKVNWQAVVNGDSIAIPLTNGYNVVNVFFKDQAGNITQAFVKMWKVSGIDARLRAA